jgi:hypothetical protein
MASEPERMPAAVRLAALPPFPVLVTQGHALTVADFAGTPGNRSAPETAAGWAPWPAGSAARMNRAAVITFGKPAANGLA